MDELGYQEEYAYSVLLFFRHILLLGDNCFPVHDKKKVSVEYHKYITDNCFIRPYFYDSISIVKTI